MVPFFCLHFGFFTFVHGMFVSALISSFAGFGPAFMLPWALVPASGLILMFVSHGYSFFTNYLWGGEVERTNLVAEMRRPYGRVVILHLTILASGFAMIRFFSTGGPAGASQAARIVLPLVLIVVKALVDAWQHLRSHDARLVQARLLRPPYDAPMKIAAIFGATGTGPYGSGSAPPGAREQVGEAHPAQFGDDSSRPPESVPPTGAGPSS